MGQTTLLEGASCSPTNQLSDGTPEGTRLSERCWGTYIHGILDNPAVVDRLLAPFSRKLTQEKALDYASYKEEQYDKLADHVRQYVNIEHIYQIMQDYD